MPRTERGSSTRLPIRRVWWMPRTERGSSAASPDSPRVMDARADRGSPSPALAWMAPGGVAVAVRTISDYSNRKYRYGTTPGGPVAMPDFLVIGAPKAGTTALHAALSEHPALYMSAIKEPKFFLSDGPPPTKGGPGDALTYREHVWRRADYEALFAPAPPGPLRGESTPLYLYDRAALDRIRDTLPQARLIVIVRDPVERAHSNWAHLWSAGLEPVADFVRACGEEERRIDAGWASFWHYTGLGRYGEQLQDLFTLFPREQVLVLRYRRLVDEPVQTLDQICAFLGVPTGVLTQLPRHNVTSHPELTLAHRTVSLAQRAGSAIGSFVP